MRNDNNQELRKMFNSIYSEYGHHNTILTSLLLSNQELIEINIGEKAILEFRTQN